MRYVGLAVTRRMDLSDMTNTPVDRRPDLVSQREAAAAYVAELSATLAVFVRRQGFDYILEMAGLEAV